MSENSREWRRLFLEGVVVVLSILIAFFLDAAWDDAELAREVRQDLASVEAALSTNAEDASQLLTIIERVLDAGDVLLEALNEAPSASTVMVPDTIAWMQLMTPTFEPQLGAIEVLIASGRLTAIEDRRLRDNLAELGAVIDDVSEELVEAQTFFEHNQAPAVFPRLAMDALSHLADQFSSGENLEFRGMVAYPNSQAIRSAIEYRRYLYLQSANGIQLLLDEDLPGLIALVQSPRD